MVADDDTAAPKIEFPCRYPIKVIGDAGDDMQALVFEVMHQHAPGFDAESVKVRPSKKGNFQSVTVFITATGEPQLQTIFTALKSSPLVQMVL